MNQDGWINQVRAEVETSPKFLAAMETVDHWRLRSGFTLMSVTPPEVTSAYHRLEVLGDAGRIAREAGRRYQGALLEWRYRQG